MLDQQPVKCFLVFRQGSNRELRMCKLISGLNGEARISALELEDVVPVTRLLCKSGPALLIVGKPLAR